MPRREGARQRARTPRLSAGSLQLLMIGLPMAAAIVYFWVPWVSVVFLVPWGLMVWVDRSLKGR